MPFRHNNPKGTAESNDYQGALPGLCYTWHQNIGHRQGAEGNAGGWDRGSCLCDVTLQGVFATVAYNNSDRQPYQGRDM